MSAATLQQWAAAQKLGDLEFVGGTIKLGDESVPADETVSVTFGDKTCQYTLGSIFLQILNPDQSLVEYRKACKEHDVKDYVKASDKQTIIGYFGGSAPVAAAAADAILPAAATEPVTGDAVGDAADAAAPPEDAEKRHHHDSKKRDKPRHRGEREKHASASSSSKKRSRSHSAPSSSDRRKEKAHKTIDPEKLFSNLSVVVGKREIKAQRDAEQAKLHAALSTEGFDQVTPELLAKYKNEYQLTMAHEIPVGDSSSILKAGAGKDLSRILKLYTDTMAAHAKQGQTGGSSNPAAPGGNSQSPRPGTQRPYLIGKKPIIILPKGMTAPITMVNAYEFFSNSVFVPRDKMQLQLRTSKQAPKTTFTRTVNARNGGGILEYELMDNPKSKLHSSKDWERVVAVVVLGHAWQMKDWPGPYGDPVQLFGRTFGFYVGMEGDKVPTDLQGWSVKQARLNRDKRGLDSVTYASFWNGLDEWMTIHKPELLPQKEA